MPSLRHRRPGVSIMPRIVRRNPRALALLVARPYGHRILLRDYVSTPWQPARIVDGELILHWRLRRIVSVR